MSRWGDDEDDDFLPPTTSVGPDENGIKVYTEYKMDETGRKMKVGNEPGGTWLHF